MSLPVVWFLLGVGLLLAELFSPIFVMMFFAIGAFAAAFATFFGVELIGSLVVFASVSVLSLFLLRSLLVRTFQGTKQHAAPQENFPQKGRRGVVTQALAIGQVGEISLDGSFWRAVSDTPIAEGVSVVVVDRMPDDALTLMVQPTSAA